MSEIVAVKDISRTFASPAGPVQAVRRADLTVRPGEIVAIMGRSGSGKSTLMHLLGLLDRASSGSYRLAGQDVGDLDERSRSRLRSTSIGFVFQAFHLVDHKTVTENVHLPLIYARVPRAERVDRVHRALEQVGMLHRIDARPATLSGGERQRVAVARAIVHRPALILCDEPTGNLDSANAEAICRLLRDLADRHGIAVILVTHDQDTGDSAHRIVQMRDGVLGDHAA